MPRYEDDDDEDDRPRKNTKVPCPKCGGKSVRPGPWPWYLGTIGAIMCKAVVCNSCGHEYDEKKPDAYLATRKRNLAIGINLAGLCGFVALAVGMYFWLRFAMGWN